ncbi:MAG: hypothetical protein V4591_01800 [Bdellovibrionota bacterium]
MNDNASRVEMASVGQNRYSSMQKLLFKAQMLPEKDFETAFSTLESVVEGLNQKKRPDGDKKSRAQVANIVTGSFHS